MYCHLTHKLPWQTLADCYIHYTNITPKMKKNKTYRTSDDINYSQRLKLMKQFKYFIQCFQTTSNLAKSVFISYRVSKRIILPPIFNVVNDDGNTSFAIG
jgi:DNA-binding transcriptional regulator WhiA